MNKIEHIGIAVRDMNISVQLFQRLLGIEPYKTEVVESEGVKTVFFKIGSGENGQKASGQIGKIELLQSFKSGSAIDKFIKKRGEGIHHIAFEVCEIYAEMKRLKKEGFVLISDKPYKGADNKLVCFLHPKSTNGVLVELCQGV